MMSLFFAEPFDVLSLVIRVDLCPFVVSQLNGSGQRQNSM
jgi:hypothetical protein